MSQPDRTGDDVIKVVYEAVADFAQLLRETARARAELKRLKDDVERIGGTKTLTIKVSADTAVARAELARVAKDIVITAKVFVDAPAVRQVVRAALAGTTFKIGLSPNLGTLREQIKLALSKINASVQLGVRLGATSGATAAMRALVARLDAMGPIHLRVAVDHPGDDDLDALAARLQARRSDLSNSGGGGGPPPGATPPTSGGLAAPHGTGEQDQVQPGQISQALRSLLERLRALNARLGDEGSFGGFHRDATPEERDRQRTERSESSLSAVKAVLERLRALNARLGDEGSFGGFGAFGRREPTVAGGTPGRHAADPSTDVSANWWRDEPRPPADDAAQGGPRASLGPILRDIVQNLRDGLRERRRNRAAGGPSDEPPADDRPARSRRDRDNNRGGGGGGGGAMIAGWGALITSAIPLVPVLVAGIGALGAALLAAGAASAIFAASAIGNFKALKSGIDAAKSGVLPLSAEMQGAATSVGVLKKEYREFVTDTRAPVLDTFQAAMRAVYGVLPKLTPLVSTIAGGIQQAVGAVGDSLHSPGFAGFLSFVQRVGPAAIAGFTRGLLSLAGGVGTLLMDFEPLVHGFVDGFERMGTAFESWAASLSSSTAFHQFLDYAVTILPLVVKFLGDLIGAAVNLGVTLAPIGVVLLKVIDGLLAMIAAADPATLRTLLVVLASLYLGFKSLAIINAVAGLIRFLVLAMRAGVLGAIALRVALQALAVASVVGIVFAALTVLINKLGEAHKKAATETDEHTRSLQDLAKALNESKGVITPQIRQDAYDALNSKSVTAKVLDTRAFSQLGGDKFADSTLTLPEEFTRTGVGQKDATSGYLGDTAAKKRVDDQLDTYTAKRQADLAALPDTSTNHAARIQAQADIKLALDTKAAYDAEAKSGEALVAERKRQAEATGLAVTEEEKLLNTVKSEAAQKTALAGKISDAMAAPVVSPDDSPEVAAAKRQEIASSASVDALNNLDAAQRAQIAATKAQTDAQTALKDATKAVSQALLDAKNNLKSYQRQLRDLPLEEEQLKLNKKQSGLAYQAALNSGGATPEELAQLKLQKQRDENALQDFEDDKGPKKKELTKKLALGLEGDPGLIAARRAEKNAQVDLDNANVSLALANQNLQDMKINLDEARGMAGLTVEQVVALRDVLKKVKNKTIEITVKADGAVATLQAIEAMALAPKILALHPTWTVDQVLKEAARQAKANTPTVVPASKDGPERLDPSGHRIGGYATGGAVAGRVSGPGGPTGDRVFTRLPVGGTVALSDSEHIWTALEVAVAGGHQVVQALRAGARAGLAPAMLAGLRQAASGAVAGPAAGPAPSSAPAVLPMTGGGGLAAMLPAFTSAALPTSIPGYAGGGPVGIQLAAPQVTGATSSRSVSFGNITVNNPVREPAGTSMYRAVRRLSMEADEG